MIGALAFALGTSSAPLAGPRYLHVQFEVVAYGILGTGTLDVDRRTGWFVRRFATGPASEAEGFDGVRAWRADETGMPRIEGNVDERNEILEWSSALVRATRGPLPRAVVHSGTDRVVVTFSGYRHAGGLWLPSRIESRAAQNGVWTAQVLAAQSSSSAPVTFAPPAPPRDSSLAGITRVPISMTGGSPLLTVRVDGQALRFILDTGGQNVITQSAARRAGLTVSGGGIVAGGGPDVAAIRYARARSLGVGAAELRAQPFIVLADDALPGVDGIVGYELLARFAARLDMAHGSLALASRAAAFGPPVHAATFAFLDRQPQLRGALDDVPGAFSIDTGSNLTAQVNAAIVRSHALISRLHASVTTLASGVGGRYTIYLVRAHVLRLANNVVRAPIVDLMTHRGGSLSSPTVVANVGDGILRRWTLVFDYAHARIDFRPGGDATAGAYGDRGGLGLATQSGALVVGFVLGGTPAAWAGIPAGERIVAVDGRAVAARDRARVRAILHGPPGTSVRLRLGDGSTHVVVLRRYL